MAESEEELKSLLIKVKESEKAGLEISIQKTKIMASSPITSWKMCVSILVAQSNLILCDPWTIAHQAPLSMEFSRQEY